MAIRQYIGARYVPKLVGEWEANTFYEALSIVTRNNVSYTSKKAVPHTVGEPALNPEYWVATGNYSAQMAQLQEDMNALAGKVNTLNNTTVPAVSAKVDALSVYVTKSFPTVAAMIADTSIEKDDIVETLEYSTGKGGGATFRIKNTSDDYSISLSNGLYAHILNNPVTPSMFGCKCDGTDDYIPFNKACNFSADKKVPLIVDKGLSISGTITLKDFMHIEGAENGIEITKLADGDMFLNEGNRWYAAIRNLHLNGGGHNSSLIKLDTVGEEFTGVDTCLFDKLVLDNTTATAFNIRPNVMTVHVSDMIAFNCGIGLYVGCTDGFFENIQVYNSTSNVGAIYITGGENKFSNIKSYLNHATTGNLAFGIACPGSANSFSNIECQDIQGIGMRIAGNNNRISNFSASNISAFVSGGTTTHVGLQIMGDRNIASANIRSTKEATMLGVQIVTGKLYNNVIMTCDGTFSSQYITHANNFMVCNGNIAS